MIDIIVGLGATKTGLDLVKGVRELLKREKIDKSEIQEHLNSLQEALFQAREALGDAQELNRSLNRQIDENKRLLDIGADMEYDNDGGFYVKKSEKAQGKAIPYCPLCWKSDRKDIPLNPMFGEGYYRCDIHKSNYETSRYRRASRNSNPVYDDDL
jgi:hypothetical protein